MTIPASVTNIGLASFYGCTGVTNYTVDGANLNYSSLNGVLFDKIQATLIQFPAKVGGSYTIPSSVTGIGGGAFIYCYNLTNVIIGNSVTNLGSFAFNGCYELMAVSFSGNVLSPTNDTSVFSGDSLATAYYLPGASGWGSIFDGIPTQKSLLPPPALGISAYGNAPAVFFPTATGTNYTLQMTTNLALGNWVTVTSGAPISGFIITNLSGAAFFRLH